MMWTTEAASRFYRVPLIDYGPHRHGTLLGSGCGLMLAVMDATPLRWCVDTDALRGHVTPYALAQFCQMADAHEGLALAGWFSYSDPEPLRAIFRELPRAPVYAGHAGNTPLGVPGDCGTLEEFVAACWDRFQPGIPSY